MYEFNVRNGVLMLLAGLFAISLSYNIKQTLDLSHYKETAEQTRIALVQTQQILADVVPSRVPLKSPQVHFKPVDANELRCLSESIYFEAATQSLVGKIAVGQVVLNRMHKPNWPKTVCGVVNQKIGATCQFSWKCEVAKTIKNSLAWRESQQVAYDLLSKDRKDIVDIVEGATHFHNTSSRPNWKLKQVTKIDDHLFYK